MAWSDSFVQIVYLHFLTLSVIRSRCSHQPRYLLEIDAFYGKIAFLSFVLVFIEKSRILPNLLVI